MQANYTLAKDPLSLDRIRSILNRFEDTIIFSLIERAQFAHNPKIYERGVFRELEALQFKGSWLEWFLRETEAFHGAPTPPSFPQVIHPSYSLLGSQRKRGDTQGQCTCPTLRKGASRV
jgi:hypothetical protein